MEFNGGVREGVARSTPARLEWFQRQPSAEPEPPGGCPGPGPNQLPGRIAPGLFADSFQWHILNLRGGLFRPAPTRRKAPAKLVIRGLPRSPR